MERADALVDIGPRRPRAERQDPRPEPPEGARRHTIRRAVGAVEDDREPAEVERERGAEEVDVVGLRSVVLDQLADPRAPRPRRLVGPAEPPLDLVFPRVGELRALRGEELDAVVLELIVRGAQHDAAVRLEPAREERDGRRRQDADRVAVGAGGEEPGDQRRLEQRAGVARVAADDEPGALGAVLGLKRGGELPAHAKGEVGREGLLVGDAADAVSPEQARH